MNFTVCVFACVCVKLIIVFLVECDWVYLVHLRCVFGLFQWEACTVRQSNVPPASVCRDIFYVEVCLSVILSSLCTQIYHSSNLCIGCDLAK